MAAGGSGGAGGWGNEHARAGGTRGAGAGQTRTRTVAARWRGCGPVYLAVGRGRSFASEPTRARRGWSRPSPARDTRPPRAQFPPAASRAAPLAAISHQKHQSRQQQPRHYSHPRAGARAPWAAHRAPWAAHRAPWAAHQIGKKKRPTSALVSLPVLSWSYCNLGIVVTVGA